MTASSLALCAILLTMAADFAVRVHSFNGVADGSTELVALLNVASVTCLAILARRARFRAEVPARMRMVLAAFLAWTVLTFIHGAFNATDYWDWKLLVLSYLFSACVPLSLFVGLRFRDLRRTLHFHLRWVFPLGLVLFPLLVSFDSELYARLVAPQACLLLLALPYLRQRWRVLVVVVAIAAVVADVSYRTNVLRIGFAAGVLLVYFLQSVFRKWLLNLVVVAMLLAPVVLFGLGVTGTFNIFDQTVKELVDDEVTAVGGGVETTSNLNSDTRTFLYVEVLQSMNRKGSSYIFGEGAGSGYTTQYFDVKNERGRYVAEVGFLTTLLYSGGVGVVLYALVLAFAAHLGINRSANRLSKLIALNLLFHWDLFFIEDIVKFDLNFVTVWLSVGLLASSSFRTMTDARVRQFFRFGAPFAATDLGLCGRWAREQPSTARINLA